MVISKIHFIQTISTNEVGNLLQATYFIKWATYFNLIIKLQKRKLITTLQNAALKKVKTEYYLHEITTQKNFKADIVFQKKRTTTSNYFKYYIQFFISINKLFYLCN